VRGQQIAKVVGQLGFGERVDLMVEIFPQPPDGTGIRLDGLGLQAFEFKVLEVGLIIVVEVL
jgi:hypothetical protein